MSGLTARFVASVKGEPGKRVEYAEGSIKGLALRVMPPQCEGGRIVEAGAKSWALRYRTPSGAQRRLTLGGYPTLGLKEARDEALKALGQVAGGRDVARDKQADRRRARLGRTDNPQTLVDLWAIYEREILPKKRAGTAAYQTWLWEKRLCPALGKNELATLDRSMIRLALKSIGDNTPTTANRAQALLRHMLNQAVADEYLAATPLVKVKALYEEVSRERVLTDDELKALWSAWAAAPKRDDMPVSARMVAALKLVLLTGTRPGDVAGLHVRELDRVSLVWTIPSVRFKGKKEHTVPLSPAAWALLIEVMGADPEEWTGHAFPNARDSSAAMERASITKAMARIVSDARLQRVTPHDLRRTAATYLASERVGAAPHIVSAILGHAAEGPAVTQTYNRHRYDREKRAALEAWADLLAEVVTGKPRATNVTSIGKARGRKK